MLVAIAGHSYVLGAVVKKVDKNLIKFKRQRILQNATGYSIPE
jgi:hypothetical protein